MVSRPSCSERKSGAWSALIFSSIMCKRKRALLKNVFQAFFPHKKRAPQDRLARGYVVFFALFA